MIRSRFIYIIYKKYLILLQMALEAVVGFNYMIYKNFLILLQMEFSQYARCLPAWCL